MNQGTVASLAGRSDHLGTVAGVGALSDEQAVLNLLHTYAERVDNGDFDGVGELFERADYHMAAGRVFRGAEVAAVMRSIVLTYDGGRPGTKHLVTNTIIDRDGDDVIRTRSYYTVNQAVEGLAMQPIISGRYLDTFHRTDGAWHFHERTITADQIGDLSRHLRRPTAVADGA